MADGDVAATAADDSLLAGVFRRLVRVANPPSNAARRSLIRLLPGVSRPLSAALFTITVVGAVQPALFIVATGALVGSIPGAVGSGLHSPEGRHLVALLWVTGVVYLLQQVAVAARAMVAGSLGRRVTARLEHDVMTATLAPPGIGHLEDPAVLDEIRMAQGVGPSQTTGPGGVTPGTAVAGVADQWSRRIQGLAAVLIVARFRWWLGALLLAGQVTNLRLYARAYFQYLETATGTAQGLRRAAYFRDLGLGTAGAKEIRVFGLAGWVTGRFERAWTAAMHAVWTGRRTSASLQVVPLLIEALMAAVAFVVLGRAAIAGQISLGQLVSTAQAVLGVAVFSYLYTEDLQVAYGSGAVPAALAVSQRLVPEPAVSPGGDRAADGLPRHEIRFEGVAFRYPGSGADVFSCLDLTLRAGESLAVVGRNGSGKTTLVKLLARLYDPDSGRITVDGIDLRELDPAAWQHRVAAIFQDFVRYPMSALDNIALGSLDAGGDREAVVRAAERAGIAGAVDRLPNGWDTVLGRQFRGGAELSGGQWQRVALARALFATDAGAGVLVLDEPTANLDVRAEAELYDRFLALTHGVTTVVISHRFSTVRRADRIVVVEGGTVVEQGTHDALVASGGGYAEMFRLQSDRFAHTTGDAGARP